MFSEKIYRLSQEQLHTHLKGELSKHFKKHDITDAKKYLYAAGSHPVLLVAHLDTVHKKAPTRFYYSADSHVTALEGIGGDDRNGVCIILEILKHLNCSVLFCHDEEIGGHGASAFVKSSRKVNANYIIEFDRRGDTDACFYDCDNDAFTSFIESTGYFKEAFGSFSDISIIAPGLGLAAVNLSSGYYNAHRNDEYISIDEMSRITKNALELIKAPLSAPFEYVERVYHSNYGAQWQYYGYDDTSVFVPDTLPIYSDDGEQMHNCGITEAGEIYDLENGDLIDYGFIFNTSTASPIYSDFAKRCKGYTVDLFDIIEGVVI